MTITFSIMVLHLVVLLHTNATQSWKKKKNKNYTPIKLLLEHEHHTMCECVWFKFTLSRIPINHLLSFSLCLFVCLCECVNAYACHFCVCVFVSVHSKSALHFYCCLYYATIRFKVPVLRLFFFFFILLLLFKRLQFFICVCVCAFYFLFAFGMRLHFVSCTKFIQSGIVCLFRFVDFLLTRKENFTVTVWM